MASLFIYNCGAPQTINTFLNTPIKFSQTHKVRPSDMKGGEQTFQPRVFQSSNSRGRDSPLGRHSGSCGRRAVGVTQHWVEGAGEVVGQRTAIILFRQRHQAGENQQHEEEQVEGEGSS